MASMGCWELELHITSKFKNTFKSKKRRVHTNSGINFLNYTFIFQICFKPSVWGKGDKYLHNEYHTCKPILWNRTCHHRPWILHSRCYWRTTACSSHKAKKMPSHADPDRSNNTGWNEWWMCSLQNNRKTLLWIETRPKVFDLIRYEVDTNISDIRIEFHKQFYRRSKRCWPSQHD